MFGMGQSKHNEGNVLKALYTQACFCSEEENKYSGCARHMTGDKSMFLASLQKMVDVSYGDNGKVNLLLKVI